MKGKLIARRSVDTAMALAMLALMAHGAMSDLAHEILGMATLGLFAVHHILNAGWHRAYFKRPRLDGIPVVDGLLFAAMMGAALSSVLVSKAVFASAHIEGGLFARRLHACTTAWCFILASIHLGLHLDIAGFGAVLDGVGRRPSLSCWLRCTATAAIASYGVYGVFIHGLPARLAMYYAYSFWPEERNWLLYIDMAAVLCFFSCAASLASHLPRKLGKAKLRTDGVRSMEDEA